MNPTPTAHTALPDNDRAEVFAALERAAQLVKTARSYFPKSMHNSDRFSLELTSAAIGKALARLESK